MQQVKRRAVSSITRLQTEPIQILNPPLIHSMMFVLLPDLTTLAKLIGQVSQEEIQVLLTLLEFVLETLIEILHRGLGRRIGHLIGKHGKILLGVS